MSLHPLIQSILDDTMRAARFAPVRECPLCRTSDAATQAGARLCERCGSANWTCEDCGGEVRPGLGCEACR